MAQPLFIIRTTQPYVVLLLQEHQQYFDKHLGKGQHMAAISVQVEWRRTQSETRSDRGLKSADPAQAAAVCWNISSQVKQGQQRLPNPNYLNSQMFPFISVALLKEDVAAFKRQPPPHKKRVM